MISFDMPPKGRKTLVDFAMSEGPGPCAFRTAFSNLTIILCKIESVFFYLGFVTYFDTHPLF